MLEWLRRRWNGATRAGHSPARDDGPDVAVIQGGRVVPWRRIAGLEDAGPDDRDFAVDPATGSIVFGDGVHGCRPEPGQVVRVRPGGAGAAGNLGDLAVRLIEFEFPFEPAFKTRARPGRIHQVMPAGGWMLVEVLAEGERRTSLVGWALSDPHVPTYPSGGEPLAPTDRTVRGLIAPAGGHVRIVDEQVASFAGYRQAGRGPRGAMSESSPPIKPVPFRLFWLLVLSLHAAGAAACLYLTPGGFPAWHPRFWSNRVAPLIVLTAVVVAVVAARRGRVAWIVATFGAFAAAWASAAVAARIAFPITMGRLFLIPLAGAAILAAATVLTSRRMGPTSRVHILALSTIAALIGAPLPFTLKAPAPDTRPLNPPVPVVRPPAADVQDGGRLAANVLVHPGDGSLTVTSGRLRLSIQPLLRFISRSPDGCWTILAPRDGPEPRLRSSSRDGSRFRLAYRADDDLTLLVDPGAGPDPLRLEATARLPRPVDSHLNSFCDIDVAGHRRLSVSFSPCPETTVEVGPADYPSGRPLRLAYLDADGRFHVVEASSGEKGPFRELASGPLERGQPLAITLHDEGVPRARITLDDWSAQAGTSPSPTAGWGLPVNAIEFFLVGDDPTSPAAIYTTLAGTSVGRGWDSVGHRAGVYRNRMSVQAIGGDD